MDDYVGYLKAPVGTWNGKTYRISIDGDCHNFNYRSDYFKDAGFASAWKAEGHKGAWGVPKTWQQVQEVSKFLKGKKDPTFGGDAVGYLDPCKGWGGFGFYFLASRATAYAKHPNDPAWLFDADTMKPRINNPAWVRAIQDVIDVLPSQPANQLNADPGTTAFQQFLAGTGSMLSWWGDVGSMAKTSDGSVVGDVVGFDILPGSDDVYNSKTGRWDTLPGGPNYAPNMAYIGWGVYVMARVDSNSKKRKAAWSAAAHLGGKISLFGLLRIRQVFSPIETVTSILMSGLMQDMIEHLSRLIWIQNPTPTTIQMQRLSLEFRGFFSTTVLPKMSCQKFMLVSMMSRPEQITLRRPGRNLLTKLAGKSNLRSTVPHLVCS
jgi:ABC-type glycerol-3-phosphate transport system substrate-binding protein